MQTIYTTRNNIVAGILHCYFAEQMTLHTVFVT